jgi:hypothetical protein
MLAVSRAKFIAGGPQRMQFTIMPAVFSALSLARRVLARERAVAESAQRGSEGEGESDAETSASFTPPQFSSRKVFQYVMEAIVALAPSQPEQALKLFLNAAQV